VTPATLAAPEAVVEAGADAPEATTFACAELGLAAAPGGALDAAGLPDGETFTVAAPPQECATAHTKCLQVEIVHRLPPHVAGS